MTKRSIALVAGVALSLAVVAGWQRCKSVAVQASGSSSTAASPEQTASPDPKTVTWEYKILTGAAAGVSVVRVTSGGPRVPSFGPNVEEEINKLSAQGYVVESFQTCCTTADRTASGVISGPPELVVLLRRMRK